MKQTIFALAAAALVAAAMPSSAEARCYGCAVGAGVAAGVIGGAIIGGAIANSAPAPVYVAPAPPPGPPSEVYYDEGPGPVCHVENRREWIEGFGWRVRRVEICD
ncbi:MAG TPA: hypothetical protein VFB31_12635 [Pseudolabrys sp.]|nr:hypothetical protein [Pseudolabrys sp.]